MLWDLYQQYRIEQLDRQVDGVRDAAAAMEGFADLRAAARLDDKVNRLALICRAMFELMQASGAVTEEQLKAKIVEIDLRDGQADGKITQADSRSSSRTKAARSRSGRFRIRAVFGSM